MDLLILTGKWYRHLNDALQRHSSRSRRNRRNYCDWLKFRHFGLAQSVLFIFFVMRPNLCLLLLQLNPHLNGKLCRYALTYLQDEHQAEDVVQETFIKIWEQKKDLIDSPNIKFYLITAVRNNCISFLRKQKTQQVIYTEDTPEPDPEPYFTAKHHEQEAALKQQKIADALNQLPPKCREVFLMIKMHGMSYKQAAEALDISVKTIENQMGKAIKVLREYALLPSSMVYLILFIKKLFAVVGVDAFTDVL
ncbi:MAG: RNA polymerase sigma-70 factor [Sphingobacteriales bacterium]|nr:MAG: RNA polymerase sigma-70 factor [Sphingobacteriales bacterium]